MATFLNTENGKYQWLTGSFQKMYSHYQHHHSRLLMHEGYVSYLWFLPNKKKVVMHRIFKE